MSDDGGSAADRGPATPLHAPAELDLGGTRLRQACWDSVPAPVRDRLNQLAGTVVEWWASPDPGDPGGAARAGVFGDAGLYLATPRPRALRKAGYSISGYEILSGSLSQDTVDHRPSPDEAAPVAGTGIGTGTPGTSGSIPGLTPEVKGTLGNLPPRAQQLLQAPFAFGQQVRQCERFYEGYPHHLYMFVLYLAGSDDLTVATGTKLIPDGHSDATAHWSLQIHRALATFRPGD